MTTEIVFDTLTDGWRPMGRCFLYQGDICAWDSEMQLILIKLIDDAVLWTACERFLLSHGLVCANMDEVGFLAKRFDWPNWNRKRSKNGHSSFLSFLGCG